MTSPESSSSAPDPERPDQEVQGPEVRDQGLPRWKLEYGSAVQETDHRRLFKRIEVAEAAILSRREVLMQSSDGFVERQEIKVALAELRNLKKDVLKFL